MNYTKPDVTFVAAADLDIAGSGAKTVAMAPEIYQGDPICTSFAYEADE